MSQERDWNNYSSRGRINQKCWCSKCGGKGMFPIPIESVCDDCQGEKYPSCEGICMGCFGRGKTTDILWEICERCWRCKY